MPTSWRSAHPAYGGCSAWLDSCRSAMTRSAGRFTTCAAPWTFQPVYRELGHPGVDDRGGHRDHLTGGEGATRTRCPGSSRTMGRSSWPRTFKEFTRISGMTHVRTSPFYSAVEWRSKLAQIAQRGVHPPRSTVVAR